MKTVIRSRFLKLEDPQDHTDCPDQVKLVNTLRSSSLRDLVKWCPRAQDTFTRQQLAEILYQDAVDIFCRFIHDKRTFIAQEFAFTFDISKDQARLPSSPSSTSQPSPSSLQVARAFVPLSSSLPSLPPLHSVTHHISSLLVGETGVGKTAQLSPQLPAI